MAARFAVEGPLEGSYLLDDLDSHLSALVQEAEPFIEAETGFLTPVPAVARVLTRRQWAVANVDSMLALMDPLLQKVEKKLATRSVSPLQRMAYGPALGAQLGVILGFLSQRVLGQYDMLAGHENQVWFVGPNMVLIEKRFGFVPRDFRLWVAVHELTHRAQFEGNPWLKEHFLKLLNELLGGMDIDPGSALKRVVRRGNSGEPYALRLLDEDQLRKFNEVQAFMSVIEGHGNFVMDRIGQERIPTQPRMRRTLQGGALTGGIVGRFLSKLLGMDLKKAQYRQGQEFFDAVFASGGRELVSHCFAASANLPSLEEVKNPQLWVERHS